MNLAAYENITDLTDVLKYNGISVPRLRGVELMGEQTPYSTVDIDEQVAAWNKYAGRKDILYIHARIGGPNWKEYKDEVINKPWFIEKVDDAFDNTYCDIYARIKED